MSLEHLFDFDAGHHIPSIANGETVPSRYGHPQWLAFTPHTADITTYFQRGMSPAVNQTGIRLTLSWSANAVGGVAVWGVAFAPYGPGTSISSYPFKSEHLGIATYAGAAHAAQYVTITVPWVDVEVFATYFFRLRLRHLGSHASRTIAVAPYFLSVVGYNAA